ncbi:MAG: tetratricopeptide repeat protein [Chloroflexi bacterium]|nr:tetratricopeptide repeat protein [Chloroflexota bacterium]
MTHTPEDDDLRARIARDLEHEEPNTELAPPERSAEVETLLTQGDESQRLGQALALARAGRRQDALQVLSQTLEDDPEQTDGWLLMAALADNAMIARACLEQALLMDPSYMAAQSGLDWMNEHGDQVPAHLLDELAPPTAAAAPPVEPEEVPPTAAAAPPAVEPEVVPVVEPEAPLTVEEAEDDLRARIRRDLDRDEPDTELAPPPPSAEVEALIAQGGDPIEQALALARAGRNTDALQVLSPALDADSTLDAGWVLMAALSDNAMVAQVCLEQAADYPLAQAGLDWMREHPGQVPTHLMDELAGAPAVEPEAPLAVEPVPVAEPEPEPVVEPEPEPVTEPEPVPVIEPEPVPVIEPEPVPVVEPEPVLVIEPEVPPVVPEAVVEEAEDDLRARIRRDLDRDEPDTELAPPPPSAEVEALIAEGGDPIQETLILARAGRNEDALHVLSQALEQDPELAPAWVLMAALTDNAIVARSCLEQAMLLDPDNPEALDGLRWMDHHPGEVPAFILGEARPSRIPSVPDEIVVAAGAIARKLEKELGAPKEPPEPEAVPVEPSPPPEIRDLIAQGGEPIAVALDLVRAGRNDEALQALSQALVDDPNLVAAWVFMAALADNSVVARSCLEQALLLDPDSPEALDGLRWMDQHPDEVPAFLLGEARPGRPQLAGLEPAPALRDVDDLVGWATAAIQEEQYEDARLYLERAVQLDPNHQEAWLQMAFVAQDRDEVRECLNRVLAINPENQEALEVLHWMQESAEEALPLVAVTEPAAPAPPEPEIAVVAPPEPMPEPVTAPPAPPRPIIVRPPVRYSASRRLQQLQKAPPAPPGDYPFTQPEAPFPQRRGCRSLFMMGIALLAALIVLGSATVGLTQAAGLWPHNMLVAPTATLTREAHLAYLWNQSETALAQGDWPTAIQLLQQVQALDPARAGLDTRCYQAYLNYGLALVAADQYPAAIAQFDLALAIQPEDAVALKQRQIAGLYWEGYQSFETGDWGTATAKFAQVYFLDPTYRTVANRLYLARCRFGHELLEQGRAEAALEQYDLALQVVPEGQDAVVGRQQAQALVPTPTPTPQPTPTPAPQQRIEISISQQRFRAYQDGALVFDLVCSTGEPARPTKPGNFKVLDKIPMAYSSVWDLKMPWWLGIYWSGSTENGIHALPILKNGQTLWAGFLGQPVSFGCIILDTTDAKRVYDWVQIGTPVTISY